MLPYITPWLQSVRIGSDQIRRGNGRPFTSANTLRRDCFDASTAALHVVSGSGAHTVIKCERGAGCLLGIALPPLCHPRFRLERRACMRRSSTVCLQADCSFRAPADAGCQRSFLLLHTVLPKKDWIYDMSTLLVHLYFFFVRGNSRQYSFILIFVVVGTENFVWWWWIKANMSATGQRQYKLRY